MAPTVQDYIELVIDVPAFLFHISMTIFLIAKIHKNHPDFNGGFYHIFVITAIIDIIGYLNVS
jgi:hypothetical protein